MQAWRHLDGWSRWKRLLLTRRQLLSLLRLRLKDRYRGPGKKHLRISKKHLRISAPLGRARRRAACRCRD